MANLDFPKTYAEARSIGVYRDWYSILLTNLTKRTHGIAINLLEKGVSIEKVYEIIGLSEDEHKLRNSDYWNRICATIDDRSKEISLCFKAIVNERICEITKKLLAKCSILDNILLEDVSNITGLSETQVKELIKR